MNDIANLCDLVVGADIQDVAEGMKNDRRIGDRFLNAGIGYGGSCVPKDTKTVRFLAEKHSYKLRTDDLREAPSLDNVPLLLKQGADIYAYDAVGEDNFQKHYPEGHHDIGSIIYTANPEAYIESNLVVFFNILECCRHAEETGGVVEHLVYASSSSVYGSNKKVPYSVEDKVDNPVSLYAATKKSNELMAHAYSKLYGIPSTGLRFFTVYGPMDRPDMAYFKFTDKILKGKTIQFRSIIMETCIEILPTLMIS